MIIMLV